MNTRWTGLLVALFVITAAPSARADFFTGQARTAALAEIERLKGIQSRQGGNVLSLPGVFGLGIGFDRSTGALTFEVLADSAQPAPKLPATLEGVKVVLVREPRPVPTNGGAACVPCHATQLALPVQMGNSGRTVAVGSNCGACTMGFKACNPVTGNSVWVGASHCAADATTCPGSAPLGSPAYHVSPADAFCAVTSQVGTLGAVAPPVANGTVDAAAINSTVAQTLPSIRDIGGTSIVPGVVVPGDNLQKSGRSTGYQTGSVASVNNTVTIGYNCGSITLTQQVRAVDLVTGLWSQGGDSGSGVLNMASPPQIVGLSIARSGVGAGYFNTITNVLAALGLVLDQTACAETACPALDLSHASSDPARSARLLYLLRDDVLAESDRGRGWIHTFYQVSASWLALYAQRPALFEAAKNSLNANLSVLDALANKRPVTVTRSQLDAFSAVLSQHVAAAQDPALRAAFQQWLTDVNNAAVQAELKVTVR